MSISVLAVVGQLVCEGASFKPPRVCLSFVNMVYFVFLVSRDCCVALPHSDMGAVCDCGIFLSYSLFLFGSQWKEL